MLSRSFKNLALGCVLVGLTGAVAAAQEPPNGDFEDGVLEPWSGSGDVGVSQDNVLEGNFSAFLTTGENAVGEVCSTLSSEFVFPPTENAEARLRFLVRYKTDEGTGPFAFFQDPFHAELVTSRGALDLLTIKTDAIFFTRGEPTNIRVRGGSGPPPAIPEFESGDEFGQETGSLLVRTRGGPSSSGVAIRSGSSFRSATGTTRWLTVRPSSTTSGSASKTVARSALTT
jgi:hypothetical protein